MKESKVNACRQKLRKMKDIPPMLAIPKLPELLDALDGALAELQERLDAGPR